MQGPFRGVAGSLARAFGGTVTLWVGTPSAEDVQAIFRNVPMRVDGFNGVEVETLSPTLRGPYAVLSRLSEGDVVDPKDGELYRFLYMTDAAAPASDGLFSARLEVIL